MLKSIQTLLRGLTSVMAAGGTRRRRRRRLQLLAAGLAGMLRVNHDSSNLSLGV